MDNSDIQDLRRDFGQWAKIMQNYMIKHEWAYVHPQFKGLLDAVARKVRREKGL